MEKLNKASAQNKRYLTAQEGAEYLSISLRTLRTLLAKREIPYIQPSGKGGLVRLDIQDLDAFMLKNKVHCLGSARL
ncbi:MAG: DNA-binding protein [Desulfobacteraceae bacterium]|nr:MAG: DNA-binding protein [Desulfobacteraceae bacterium]